MNGLEMKYFVLKPRSKEPDDDYAHASRQAIKEYARCIESVNPDLAMELLDWRAAEIIKTTRMMDD